jgi:hypothetical protein
VTAVEESFKERGIRVLSGKESLERQKAERRRQAGKRAGHLTKVHDDPGYLDRHLAECERLDAIEERKRDREDMIEVERDKREQERERAAISAEVDRRELEETERARDRARTGYAE